MDTDPGRASERTWFVPSLLLLAATAVLGAYLYPGMPDPVPVHWNGAGIPDRFAGKSVFAVFSPLLIGTGVVAFLWLLYRFLPAMASKGAQDAARAALEARAGKDVLAALTPALAILFSWLCVTGWLELTSVWTIWPPMLLLMGFALRLVIRAVRHVTAPPTPPR
ncbi:DUF1648 domain-containing protein [Pseudarthrobacter chlorophenolicus]|uniref:DUF1648 domain-containing protein n=1 Tax=Pseudarthrobacter chlorophenolicus TaxID=85085 RepID=UPI000698DDDC|nr:DUF1648 domain-containing protein [Pseudarthrobacter chlorophenolicus]